MPELVLTLVSRLVHTDLEESMMTDELDVAGSTWYLLAELSPATESNRLQRATRFVAETMQELGLQPALVERIQNTVIEALQGVWRSDDQAQQNSPVRIRIWTTGASRAASPKHNDQRRRSGWGFFLLEKRGDRSEEPWHRFELYLYQETGKSPMPNRSGKPTHGGGYSNS